MIRWTTACPDWQDRIVRGESLVPLGPIFPGEASAAWEVFGNLRLVDVAGEPTMAEAVRPWVRALVDAIFGSYDAESGRRLIREYFLLIAKKNTKSTLAAGTMLTALVRNWRREAEFLILAPTIEIANNSFGPASAMVRADADLAAIFHVADHTRTITHLKTGATLKVVAADDETVSGKKATGVLVDELWLFGKRPNAGTMLREATGGLASRPEGFVIFLSTHGDEAPAGAFKEKLDYFRDVRDGLINDPQSLPVLYEFPPAMLKAEAYRDPANFYITNPNLGASVDEEFLRRELKKAERNGEHDLLNFFAKHLNVEIGLALRSGRWAGAEHWPSCADPSLTLEALLARSEVVVAGVDGGGLDDLLGLALVGRERGTRRWLVWNRAWAHPVVLERRKSEAPRLRDLEATGDLVFAAELGDDVREVGDIVARVRDAGLLGGVGVDPVGIADVLDELQRREIDGEVETAQGRQPLVVAVSQGWKMAGAIKTLERALAAGTVAHPGQALMDWCVGNAKAEPRGNAIAITKQASGTAKIDPLVACFMAVELMTREPQPAGRSVYDAIHDDEADAEAAKAPERADPAVLANPRHPEWERHRRIHDAQLEAADDDD